MVAGGDDGPEVNILFKRRLSHYERFKERQMGWDGRAESRRSAKLDPLPPQIQPPAQKTEPELRHAIHAAASPALAVVVPKPQRLTADEVKWLHDTAARCIALARGGVVGHLGVDDAPAWARAAQSAPVAEGSYVYVVEVVGHCVKVGISSRPRRRLRDHDHAARRMGRETGRRWVSDRRYRLAREIERDLLTPNELSMSGEYLNVPFEAAVEMARASIARWEPSDTITTPPTQED